MKFSCQKTSLVQALQMVTKAVSPKNQNPILSGIYIKAENNIVELQATDHEIGVICRLEANVEIPGIIVVAGKIFQDVVRKQPGVYIEINYNSQEKNVQLKSNHSQITLLSMPASDFPVIHKLDGVNSFTIMDNTLRELIDKTSFASSNEESRPVFTGCLLELNEESIVMVATDTKRLAVLSKIADESKGIRKMIIPAKILSEISKSINSDMPQQVKVNYNSNQISFEFDNTYITSRLIEGQFPDYHRVIPASFKTRIKINTEDFRAVLDRVAIISRTNDYNIASMSFANGQVRITSDNPELGNAEEVLPAEIDGEDIEISFNADFVTDVLKIISNKEFYMSINTPLSPVAIRIPEDESFTYIITPVRTPGR